MPRIIQQCSNQRPIHNHQARYVLCHISGYRCALLRMQACNTVQRGATRNGASAVQIHTSHHRKQHSTQPHNGHYDFKILQFQQHDVPVVEVLQSAADVCIPLGTQAQE